MRHLRTQLFLTLLLLWQAHCFADGPSTLELTKAEFKVFDGLLFVNKPDLSPYGIKPIKIAYQAQLWKDGQDISKMPDLLRIKNAVNQLDIKNSILVIDVEHWLVTEPNGEYNPENLAKQLQLLATFRKLSPSTQFGNYGIPYPDYWRASNSKGPEQAAQWRIENDRMQAIVDQQDIVMPSLYTFYADRDGWVKYAIAQMAEARRLAKGKPVYVFLWPQYHESNPLLGNDYIHPDYWKMELETVKKYADGIVIWGGWQQTWDDEAEWWKATKEFMNTIKQ
ncbi:MAG: hypothetical protein ACKN9T_06840 [Candidatus Methylumidiphilus sp.]